MQEHLPRAFLGSQHGLWVYQQRDHEPFTLFKARTAVLVVNSLVGWSAFAACKMRVRFAGDHGDDAGQLTGLFCCSRGRGACCIFGATCLLQACCQSRMPCAGGILSRVDVLSDQASPDRPMSAWRARRGKLLHSSVSLSTPASVLTGRRSGPSAKHRAVLAATTSRAEPDGCASAEEWPPPTPAATVCRSQSQPQPRVLQAGGPHLGRGRPPAARPGCGRGGGHGAPGAAARGSGRRAAMADAMAPPRRWEQQRKRGADVEQLALIHGREATLSCLICVLHLPGN